MQSGAAESGPAPPSPAVHPAAQGLVEQVRRGRCALFLGPDAAESAQGFRGLPTTWQLADELAARCGYRGQYRPLPQMAQVCEHTRGRQDLISFLKERLDDANYQPLPLHELIARIPFAVIVQAGWDYLLERALRKQGVPYQVVQAVHDIPYTLPSGGLLLYKPYGSLDRPDSLVITEDDQLNVFYQLQALKRRLADLMASYSLLMIGYAPDYDSVFVRIYHEIRQEQGPHRPPALVVQSLSRPGDAAQWESRGIEPLVAEPVTFLYGLARAVAEAEGRELQLPPLEELSQAPTVTPADLAAQTQSLSHVLDTVGVATLVEQTDVPLLSAQQVRDLEAMRAAYERLAETLEPTTDSAQVWLRQGNIEYARQNFEKAQHYYELALAAQPRMAEAYHNLHYLHLAENRPEEALTAYRQAVALDPSLALLPARYQIEEVLGRGGMGVVYRARDAHTGGEVAVKVLDRAHMRTDRLVTRFRREAEILRRVQHPHIVGYLDFDQYQGRYFIVMEYLGRQTLARTLAERGRLPLDEAYEILRQLGEAVSFAHGQGIIHRDIKPANIFLVDGQAKLIDFGLAADLEAGQPSTPGLATGTVAYMAPEQVEGGAVDGRTDVYALATVFYEMVSGRHPAQGAYRPASELAPGLDDGFDLVLQQARQRAPSERYPSVSAFVAEVEAIMPFQPASRRAAGWRRSLARLQRGLVLLAGTYWPVVLPAIVAGFLLAPLLPQPGQRAAVRVAALLTWDALLMVNVTGWFTAWLGRRTGYASLAAYGPLLGLVLGPGVGFGTYWWLMRVDGIDFASRTVDAVDNVSALLAQSMFCTVIGGLAFLAMTAGARLAVRQRLGSRSVRRVGYGLALVVFAGYTLLLAVTNSTRGG